MCATLQFYLFPCVLYCEKRRRNKSLCKEETNPLKLVEKKKIYDRNTYNKEKFLDDLKKANWSVIYQQNNANEMLKSFTKIFTRVLQKHAPLKNVFIRNDKSCFARSQTWLKEKNNELQKECDSSSKPSPN